MDQQTKELHKKIDNLNQNFSELVKTIVNMQSELTGKINKLEMKQLTTINNLKVVKETLREIQRNQMIHQDKCESENVSEFKIPQHEPFEDSIKKLRQKREMKQPVKQQLLNSPQEQVREFRAFTESDIQSLRSKDNFFQNLREKRDSNVESFLSKMKPLDMLLGIPKNIDLENIDDSVVKTPKKEPRQIEKGKNILPFSDSDNDSVEKITYSRKSINIKNFDDFKNVLKDVKMSLNMSYYSDFNEDWQKNFEQLENLITDYGSLDEQMQKYYKEKSHEQKQTSFMGTLIFEECTKVSKSQSLNYGSKELKSQMLQKLNNLIQESKITFYEMEIKKLKNSPMNFDSLLLKIKNEFHNRLESFHKIQESL